MRSTRVGRTRLAGLSVALLAATGLLAAHALDYGLLIRDPVYRQHVLDSTGHGYLPEAGGLALLAFVVASALGWALGFGDGLRAGGRRPSFGWLVRRLGALQVAGFVALEIVERVQSGVPLHHLLSPLLPMGVLLQVAVAVVGALLLGLLWRTGAWVARAFAPPRPRRVPRVLRPAAGATVPAVRILSVSASPRGPPAVLAF